MQTDRSILPDRKRGARFRTLTLLGLFGLLLHPIVLHPLQAGERIQFSIVYTNDTMGEVEPCG